MLCMVDGLFRIVCKQVAGFKFLTLFPNHSQAYFAFRFTICSMYTCTAPIPNNNNTKQIARIFCQNFSAKQKCFRCTREKHFFFQIKRERNIFVSHLVSQTIKHHGINRRRWIKIVACCKIAFVFAFWPIYSY